MSVHGGCRSFSMLFFLSLFGTVGAPSLRFLQGRAWCCLYHEFCALRLASHLRRSSPALYHLLLLSATAISAQWAQPRSVPLNPRTDAPTLSVRGGWICRHAGAYSPFAHGTGGRHSFDSHASAEAAHRVTLYYQGESAEIRGSANYLAKNLDEPSGRRASMTSTYGRRRSAWRSCGTCIAIP